jgi:release factor glutamine methyltransferase
MEAATEQRSWTVLSLLDSSTAYLLDRGVESPRLTAELLLAHVLHCTRVQLYLNFDKPASAGERSSFKELLRRRAAHEPLQYILGTAGFMGLTFHVDGRVLIPRPETELLVEMALALSRSQPVPGILDIGTGSGNIAVSLAHCIPGCRVLAIDASEEALEVARRNAGGNGVAERITFRPADILRDDTSFPEAPFDLIVSNPPYISTEEFALLAPEIRDHEPKMATGDGGDGLTFYRKIASRGLSLLRPEGHVIVEHAYNQQEDVLGIFRGAGYAEVTGSRDYAGVPRVVVARHSPS